MPVNFLGSGSEASTAGDGSQGDSATGDSSTQGSNKRRKREDTTVKTCGTIDGIPVQCSGGDSLESPPAETTVVSSSVVFENKFIDIFAGDEPNVRKVKQQIAYS